MGLASAKKKCEHRFGHTWNSWNQQMFLALCRHWSSSAISGHKGAIFPLTRCLLLFTISIPRPHAQQHSDHRLSKTVRMMSGFRACGHGSNVLHPSQLPTWVHQHQYPHPPACLPCRPRHGRRRRLQCRRQPGRPRGPGREPFRRAGASHGVLLGRGRARKSRELERGHRDLAREPAARAGRTEAFGQGVEKRPAPQEAAEDEGPAVVQRRLADRVVDARGGIRRECGEHRQTIKWCGLFCRWAACPGDVGRGRCGVRGGQVGKLHALSFSPCCVIWPVQYAWVLILGAFRRGWTTSKLKRHRMQGVSSFEERLFSAKQMGPTCLQQGCVLQRSLSWLCFFPVPLTRNSIPKSRAAAYEEHHTKVDMCGLRPPCQEPKSV